MASRNFTATRTAADIGLGIGNAAHDSMRYRIQNVDANARLFIRESATAPMTNHFAHVVEPGGWYGPFFLSTDDAATARGVWAWSDRDSCKCVVTPWYAY